MLPPWLPDYKQCYPHGYRIKRNFTPMATGLKEMLPHGYQIKRNVTPPPSMAAGI